MSDDQENNIFIRRMRKTANLTKSHRRAPKQERALAVRVGGRLTAASGSKDEKGDVRIKGLARLECKTTKHKSFSVTIDMVEKLEEAAALSGELPIFVIEFIDDMGRPLKELAVCPSYVLDTLVGE